MHCGFCNATCPTYQLLGDELDGPRGRIYLIKQVLEGGAVTRSTQLHLDRCLTCLNCETTCPSGVEYGHLVDIGRTVVDAQVPRPAIERALRWLLREGLTGARCSRRHCAAGQALRPLLPQALRAKLGRRRAPPAPGRSARACAQGAAARRLRAAGDGAERSTPRPRACSMRIGVQALIDARRGLLRSIRHHLGDQDGGLADMRAATSMPGGRSSNPARSRRSSSMPRAAR